MTPGRDTASTASVIDAIPYLCASRRAPTTETALNGTTSPDELRAEIDKKVTHKARCCSAEANQWPETFNTISAIASRMP